MDNMDQLKLIPNKRKTENNSTLFKENFRIVSKRSKTILNILISLLIATVFIFPFYILLTNSFKSNPEINVDKLNLPSNFSFDNYTGSIKNLNFFSAVGNSLIITIVSNILIILVSAGGAWMMIRTNSRFGKTVYTIFIFSLIIPFQILMIPLVWWASFIGLEGITGIIIIYLGLGIPMTTFLLHGFVKGIPSSIEEAAIIEGAGTFKIFFRLILPLLKPIIMTALILNTIWIWNDFLLPLLILSDDDDFTIVLKVYTLKGNFGTDYALLMASLFLALIPALVFFLLAQKGIVSGITQGANK